MGSKATPSETVAWWARAAQARRVAGFLSPRDAQVAEAYAAECEDQARAASFRGHPLTRRLADRVANAASVSPRQVSLFVRVSDQFDDARRELAGSR